MSTPRSLFAMAVTAAILMLAGFTSAGGTGRLTTTPLAAAAGGTISVAGTGLTLPAVTTCEVSWDGPVLAGSRCEIKGHLVAVLPLASAPELTSTTYTVTVCAPSCAHPWAGRDTAVLNLPGGRTQGPTTDAATPDSRTSASGTSSNPQPDNGTSDTFSAPAPADTQTTSAPPAPEPFASDSPTPGNQPRAAAAPAFGSAHVAAVAFRAAAAPGTAVLTPNPASGTDTVQLEDAALPSAPDGCGLRWDRTATGSCTVDSDGDLHGTVRIPADAAAGVHALVACRADCAQPAAETGVAAVTVVAAVQPSGQRSDRSLPAGTVAVPPLKGLTVPTARLVLAPLKLRLRPAPDGSGRIVSQLPLAGAMVPTGSVVNVSLAAVSVAPASVVVPRVVGLRVGPAQAVLARQALVLVAPVPGTGPIARQDPAAGTSVTAGTGVNVAFGTVPPTGSESAGLRRFLIGVPLAALVLLAGFAGAQIRFGRGRVQPAPPAPQLLIFPDGTPAIRTEVRVPAQRRPLLHLRARPDQNPSIRTEIRR